MQHPQQLPPRATSLGAVVLFLGFAAPSWTGCAASARHPFPEIAREEAGYLEPGVPPGATCDRVQVNGAQLHYIDHGGTGPTMIFLAGLGNSAHIWDEFAPGSPTSVTSTHSRGEDSGRATSPTAATIPVASPKTSLLSWMPCS